VPRRKNFNTRERKKEKEEIKRARERKTTLVEGREHVHP
jgi:hypothetical protein